MSIGIVTPAVYRLLPLLVPGLTAQGNELAGTLAQENFAPCLAALRRERLSPLAYSQLRNKDWTNKLDPAFLAALRRDYFHSVKVSARQEREALKIFQAFHKAEVGFILLKGGDLRLRLYRDPAGRQMSDLDLLIDQAQVSQAREIMASLNYTLFTNTEDLFPGYWEHFGHELGFMPPAGGVLPIEVHWEIRAVNSLYHIPYRAIGDKTLLIHFQGIPIRLLERNYLLMHLCLHAFSHFHDDRLKMLPLYILVDIILALHHLGVDWNIFLQAVKEFHCQAPVYLTLMEVAGLINQEIPPEVFAELRRHQPNFVEKAALSWRIRLFTKALSVIRHHPPREWLSFIKGNLWPCPDYLLANYGKPDRLTYWSQFYKKNIKFKNPMFL